MRGRNRKSHNPLTRVYESNGPDVKIRGTASHIAEKYIQLARDSQTSGDPVSAENYNQHAEHYLRLIAAAQEQFRQTTAQELFEQLGDAPKQALAKEKFEWLRREGRLEKMAPDLYTSMKKEAGVEILDPKLKALLDIEPDTGFQAPGKAPPK